MNKIIVHWMYPRSLTTVFMRSIKERGDFTTVFEPCLPIYWRDRKEAGVQTHKDYEGWPVVYEDIIKKIYEMAEESPLFIKECPYHAIDKYLADEEYLKRVTNLFQIRHPKYVVLSFWKVLGTQKSLRIEDIGPPSVYRIFKRVTELGLHALDGGKTPLVIDGEDFQNDPEGIQAAWCDAVGVDYKPESLKWEPEWRQEYDHHAGFYHDVGGSSGIQPQFEKFMYDEKVVDAIFEDLPMLKMLYEHCMPIHEELYQYRLKPKKL